MDPDEVPLLKTVSVGGEALTQNCIDTWAPRVRLFNSYGPTEACIFCSIASIGPESSRANIGYPSGCRTWIVDANDHNVLVPLGEVGELVVEGEILARGYLDDLEKTAASFVTNVPWASGNLTNHNSNRRFYKTGDLARFESDGSISCLGRKDRQIKIRGQRVELGDIESHLNHHRPSQIRTAVVDYVERAGHGGRLVAFLVLRDPADKDAVLQDWDSLLTSFTTKLSQHLPSYMIPSQFFALESLPRTSSGKVDRPKLQETWTRGDARPGSKMLEGSGESGGNLELSPIENEFKAAIARILGLAVSAIDMKQSFTQLGGNSLLAIKLVAHIRKRGLQLSTKSILQPQPLHIVMLEVSSQDTDNAPHSEASNDNHSMHMIEELKSWASAQCSVPVEAVTCIQPCTPFQETLIPGLMANTGAYVAQYVFDLPNDLDLGRFKSCWERAYQAFPILRSCFLQTPENGPVRVVVENHIEWDEQDDVDEMFKAHSENAMNEFTTGNLLSAFTVRSHNDGYRFVLSLHHLLFDLWSLDLILDYVGRLYDGMPTNISRPDVFEKFVDFSLQKADDGASKDFWTSHLMTSSSNQFPRLPSLSYQPILRDMALVHVDFSPFQRASAPLLIRGSLALAIGTYSGLNDVSIGAVLSGRDADMPEIDEVVGPTLVTIPDRITWQPTQTIDSFLEDLEKQQELVTLHQHFGLSNIRKTRPGAARACDFQTLLVIQAPVSINQASGLFERRTEIENRDSHALVLECTIMQGALVMEARFDTMVISKTRVERLLGLWKHTFQQLSHQDSSVRLGSLSQLSNGDLDTLSIWNESLPPPAMGLIHERLTAWATLQPDKVALDSWDGTLTYRQLDDMSSALAASLVAYNPGQIIPLYFPKGLTLMVSLWAVLKSGRAILALDVESPRERIASILQQLDDPLVLCHDSTIADTLDLRNVQTITMESLNRLPQVSSNLWQRKVSPNDIAYMIMTSGSTGKPKGVIIEHRSIMTTMQYSTPLWGITRTSRMLQFPSVAFDAAIMDIFSAVAVGACLSIPKHVNLLDYLIDFIKEKKVNYSFFTPSFLRLLNPDDVPLIEDIVCGGEALTAEVVNTWAPRVHLVNAYGPSECSITCTCESIDIENPNVTSIGKALGCVTWIVDPEDHERLMPVGAVGELLIEGHIVGRGYYRDEEKTAASFISAPSWRRRFNRQLMTMYKTGDLVCYDDTGSLVYVGRKDSQVKLRGQRLELGEVEHHLGLAASSRPTLCFVPRHGPLAKHLVGVVGSSTDSLTPTSVYRPALSKSADTQTEVQMMRDKLSLLLPRYMVPEKIAILESMPITLSGKLDRKFIDSWIETLSQDSESFFTPGAENFGDDAGKVSINADEAALQDVWAHVLKLPTEKVGIHRSFQALGGDSLSAMQVVARCHNKGLGIVIQDLLRGDTIHSLAQGMRYRTESKPDTEMDETYTPFALSPIQRAYASLAPLGETHYFNQTAQFRLRRPLAVDDLRGAMNAIVNKHASLRTRYELGHPDKWNQRITNDVDASFTIEVTSIADSAALIKRIQDIQLIPNPISGPMIHCDLANGPDGVSRLLMVAPHLAVDIVSWRLLLEDLETVLEGETLSPAPNGLFQAWCANKLSRAVHQLDLPQPRYDYWGIDPKSLTYKGVLRETLSIDRHTTALCLGRSNVCLRTRPTDILVAAASLAFQEAFPGREAPAVCLEGHGRQPRSNGIDVSRTIGWFTSVIPVYSPIHAGQYLVDLVRDIKDARSWAEKTEADFFAAQSPSPVIQIPEIMLNFTGNLESANEFAPEGLFLADTESSGDQFDFSDNMRRFAVFDIAAAVRDGQFHFEFLYNDTLKHSSRVGDWVAAFGRILRELSVGLCAASPRPTVGEYLPTLATNTELHEVDSCLQEMGIDMVSGEGLEVTSLFQATPTQTQMLRAQQRNPTCWYTSLNFELRVSDGSPLDVQRLSSSWDKVVQCNEILRTLLVPDPRQGMDGFLNVVLKDVSPSIELTSTCSNVEDVPRAIWKQGQPEHRLTVVFHGSQEATCRLEINHALIDHGSLSVLFDSFSSAFAGEHVSSSIPYRDYASGLKAQPTSAGFDYWSHYLKESTPSLIAGDGAVTKHEERFETMIQFGDAGEQLRRASESCGVTPATICRLAWARVLGQITSADDVVFGLIVSGRDARVTRNIEQVVGPVMNIVACRFPDVRRSTPELLKNAGNEFLAGLDHQHHLVTYLHDQTLDLFDSVVNFRRHRRSEHDEESQMRRALVFNESPGSEDPYEVRTIQ